MSTGHGLPSKYFHLLSFFNYHYSPAIHHQLTYMDTRLDKATAGFSINL